MLSSILFTALVGAASVSAAKTAVTAAVFANLQRYTNYAGAAYAEDCPTLPYGSTVLNTFNNSATDIKAIVFKDTKVKQIVLSFRGSAVPRNLDQDFLFNLVPLTLTGTSCSGCQVHNGFQASYADIQSSVSSAVSSALSANTGYTLVVTGHSLGGGLASVASSALAAQGYKPVVYTFGEPRNGNPAFTTYIANNIPNYFRVTHYNDGVPQIPPTLLGFQHHGKEVWESLNTGNTASSTYTCTTNEPTDCNASQNYGTSPINGAHIQYTNQLIAPALFNPACGYVQPS